MMEKKAYIQSNRTESSCLGPSFCRRETDCCLSTRREGGGGIDSVIAFEKVIRKARSSSPGSWCVVDARLLWRLGANESLLCRSQSRERSSVQREILIASSARRNMSMIKALCIAESRIYGNGPPLSAAVCGLFSSLEAVRIETRVLAHPREAAALRSLILASPQLRALEIELQERGHSATEKEQCSSERNLSHMMTILHTSLCEQSSLVRVLSLCGCGLTEVPWPLVEVCPLLEKVSLRENLMTSAQRLCEAVAGLERLETLDLSGNSLVVKSCDDAPPWLAIGSASELCLARNRLESLRGLDLCRGIESLDLGENCIQDRDEISILGRLPLLAELTLAGNPCMQTDGTRLAALALLARRDADGSLLLPILDSKKSSRNERRQVAKLAFVPVRNPGFRTLVEKNETTPSTDSTSVSQDDSNDLHASTKFQQSKGIGTASPLDKICSSADSCTLPCSLLHQVTEPTALVTPDASARPIPIPRSESITEPTVTPVQSIDASKPNSPIATVDNPMLLKKIDTDPPLLRAGPRTQEEAHLESLFCPLVERGTEKFVRAVRLGVSLPQESETSVDVRGRPVGSFPCTRPSVLVVTSDRLYIYEGDDSTLNADLDDPTAPAPRLLFAPQYLFDLESVTIGFKFLWVRLAFSQAKTFTFPTRRRDKSVALLNVVMPSAKRKRRVNILNNDALALDLLSSSILAPHGDTVPILYAAADQFWRSRPKLSAQRILVITSNRIYLLTDHLPFHTLAATSDALTLLESVSFRRTRHVRLNDEPGLPCELTISFVDNSHLAAIASYRTWRLRFPHSAHAHSAYDLIRPRLRGASPQEQSALVSSTDSFFIAAAPDSPATRYNNDDPEPRTVAPPHSY